MIRPPPPTGREIPEINLFAPPVDLCEPVFDLEHAYSREYFARLARRAKMRDSTGKCLLTEEEVRELLTIIDGKNVEHSATMARFGLRLLRFSGREANDCMQQLRSVLLRLYLSPGQASSFSPAILAGWAEHYSSAPDVAPQKVTERPLRFWHDVRQGGDIPTASYKLGNWDLCALSHAGKFDKAGNASTTNDDAFIVSGDCGTQVLAAVTDGSGDCKDGARAARVALSSLATNLSESRSISSATLAASLAVQEDNLMNETDGACTLAAAVASEDSLSLIQVGDARFFALRRDGTEVFSNVEVTTRTILGGEPLGEMITSSGNLVRKIDSLGIDQLVEATSNVHCFALMTDGAFVRNDQQDDRSELRAILRKQESTEGAAKAIVDRALEAFRLRLRKADNVTVIVGYYRIPRP